MARTLNRLSARFVATVAEAGRYADGGNLYLSVSPNGGRRWVFMYRWQGKVREMGLGSSRTIALARARERAAEARTMLAEGVNPIDAKEDGEAAAVLTFGKAAKDHISLMEAGWSGRTAAGWRMTLTEYVKPLAEVPVEQVTTEHVLAALTPIWGPKPETAARVRARIESVLDGCKARGQRSGENPARWRGHLDKLLPPQRKLSRGHHAAMPYAELPPFIGKLRETASTSYLALELTIAAAARSSEVRLAKWGEFDLAAKLWTVPAPRMKAKREHKVPLTPRMVEILATVRPGISPQPNAFVFPGAKPGKPLSVMALAMALRRAGAGDYTPHGFRSAFRDWCGDETDFARDVVELALAHTIRDSTEAAYRRATALEKRRALMLAWQHFLDGRDTANVIQLFAANAH